MLNVERIQGVLEHITEHPDQYDPVMWGIRADGRTTMDFAGWTVAMHGPGLRFEEFGTAGFVAIQTADGKPITEAAAKLLGLNPCQVEDLLLGEATIPELWEIADRLSGRQLKVPAEFR